MTVVFNRYGLLAAELATAIVVEIATTATLIEQDVKGGPHSLYRAYPEKGSYTRTGNLGRSYHQDRSKLADPIEPQIEIGNDPGIAAYVPYVEFGTVHMQAEPHLTPATEAQRVPHELRVVEALRAAGSLKGAAGPTGGGAGVSGLPDTFGPLGG